MRGCQRSAARYRPLRPILPIVTTSKGDKPYLSRKFMTVGFVDVVDQDGELLAELRPMGGHGSYVRRLGRRNSDNDERCRR